MIDKVSSNNERKKITRNLGLAILACTIFFSVIFSITDSKFDLSFAHAEEATETTPDEQSTTKKDKKIIINEVDTNPSGPDHSSRIEWVELYNTGMSEVDIGGWKVGPTSVSYKDLTFPKGTKIGPEKYLAFTHISQWFLDSGESVKLVNSEGKIVDKTSTLKDTEDNVKSWQREYDGLDTDSESDWVFAKATLGSSNGKQLSSSSAKEEESAITVETGKDSYSFGDAVLISGKVSEKKISYTPTFSPEKIKLKITGPDGYSQTNSLFPSADLTYKSKLKADKVLGIKEGRYSVSATYGEDNAKTEFFIGEVKAETKQPAEQTKVVFDTDKAVYKPGETVSITASTTKVIPLEGLKFKVIGPNGETAYDGTLFPDSGGNFAVKIFLSSSKPVFGTYTVVGSYAGKVEPTTFEVAKEKREDVPISLKTDKNVYRLGDTVTITGRSNKAWVSSLDITITNSFTTKLEKGELHDTYRTSDIVRLEGDSTFEYEFKIPKNEKRLGTYFVKVSKDVGSASTSFKVVKDPKSYVEDSESTDEPLTVNTAKPFYEIGDELTIKGETKTQSVGGSTGSVSSVKIIIRKADGSAISFKSTSEGLRDKSVDFSFTVSPDSSGKYSVKQTLQKNIFNEGKYEVIAKFGPYTKKTTFSVIDLISSDKQGVDLIAKTDKEVYRPGDKLDLTGKFTKPVSISALDIKIKQPGGSLATRQGKTASEGVINSAVNVENSKFSWNWQIPKHYDNFGVHRLTLSTKSQAVDLFFKIVSATEKPQSVQESLTQEKITLRTDQQEYETGSFVKIRGSVEKKDTSKGGNQVGERPQITVKDKRLKEVFTATPSLSPSGNFETSLRLIPAAYDTGEYTITAKYLDERIRKSFKVVERKFDFDESDKLQVAVKTDKDLYELGDTVVITGAATQPVSSSNVITLNVVNDKSQDCSKYFRNCDPSARKQTLTFDSAMQFETTHKIPTGSPSTNTGNYTVTARTGFDTAQTRFEVVEKIPNDQAVPSVKNEQSSTKKEKELSTRDDGGDAREKSPTKGQKSAQESEKAIQSLPSPEKFFENFNRITRSPIDIKLEDKEIDSQSVSPKMFSGLLRTVNESDHSVTNAQVFYKNTCVIGQSEQCLISDSTRTVRSIYEDVELDGNQYRVRYSGPDAKLEKFSIVPFDQNRFLPESEWSVRIDGKENVFRFYYKIMYLSDS